MSDALRAAERRLDEIDDALERLEQGTYGRCAACGSAIGDAILEADPLARTCEGCRRSRAAAEPVRGE